MKHTSMIRRHVSIFALFTLLFTVISLFGGTSAQASERPEGSWQLYFQWEGVGTGTTGVNIQMLTPARGTFQTAEGYRGEVFSLGNELELRFESGTLYTGRIAVTGDLLMGTMESYTGAVGTWQALRLRARELPLPLEKTLPMKDSSGFLVTEDNE
ncbi:MAG: hypothetical protein ACKO6N_03870 [Myxococcota bacterium]